MRTLTVTVAAATRAPSHGTIVAGLIVCGLIALGGWAMTWIGWQATPYTPRTATGRRGGNPRRRSVPGASAMFSFAALLFAIDLIWGRHASGAHLAMIVCGALAAVSALIAISAVVAERPRWAIPPGLRRDGGR